MPFPQDQRLAFFVYVVESPSAPDIYHGRSESFLLQQAIALNGIPCIAKYAISKEALYAAIKLGLPAAMAQHPALLPIIHLSAHGDPHGIQLSNGEIMQWAELKELLRPVNQALRGSLILCMSSCFGYAGTRMAMWPQDPDYPFFAIVGNGGSPTWPETAVGFATFYHQLIRGEHVQIAVNAMRIASGNDTFYVEWATKARTDYIAYVNAQSVNATSAQLELNQAAQRHDPGSLEKLLSITKNT